VVVVAVVVVEAEAVVVVAVVVVEAVVMMMMMFQKAVTMWMVVQWQQEPALPTLQNGATIQWGMMTRSLYPVVGLMLVIQPGEKGISETSLRAAAVTHMVVMAVMQATSVLGGFPQKIQRWEKVSATEKAAAAVALSRLTAL
jgi:hypothetical protein